MHDTPSIEILQITGVGVGVEQCLTESQPGTTLYLMMIELSFSFKNPEENKEVFKACSPGSVLRNHYSLTICGTRD